MHGAAGSEAAVAGAHRGGGGGHPSPPGAPGWEGAEGEGVQPQLVASGGNQWHAGGGEGSAWRARVPSSHLCSWPGFRCLGNPRRLVNLQAQDILFLVNKCCWVYKGIDGWLSCLGGAFRIPWEPVHLFHGFSLGILECGW